jgi:hypothetical protein
MEKYTNRNGDVYTFTKEEGDTILWEGEFKNFRMSHPMVYKKAYQQYCKDINTLGEGDYPMFIDEFKEVIHEVIEGVNGKSERPGSYNKKYAHLLYPDVEIIEFIDPEGGPMIKVHDSLGEVLGIEDFSGLCVHNFEKIPTGLRIHTYGEFDHLADTKIIGGIINTTEK